jgi:hypothetical protein
MSRQASAAARRIDADAGCLGLHAALCRRVPIHGLEHRCAATPRPTPRRQGESIHGEPAASGARVRCADGRPTGGSARGGADQDARSSRQARADRRGRGGLARSCRSRGLKSTPAVSVDCGWRARVRSETLFPAAQRAALQLADLSDSDRGFARKGLHLHGAFLAGEPLSCADHAGAALPAAEDFPTHGHSRRSPCQRVRELVGKARDRCFSRGHAQ